MRGGTLKAGHTHRLSSKLIIGIAVGALFAVALSIRVFPPYNDIFAGNWIKFAGGDNYFYMRLVDYMTHNFPHLPTVDAYLAYPDGESVGAFYLLARILGSISWAVGLGHPSQHLIDSVCVYIPAVMGSLTVIPVYFIGRELAGRWAGLISAGLIAILPGEFLGRSILGFTDHHVAEALFSSVAMMFLIMAVKSAKGKELGELKTKPIVYSLLAGVFLGVYLLTWTGGLLFVFLMFLCLAAQLAIDHLRRQPTGYLAAIGLSVFLVASVMFLPTVHFASFVVSMLGVAVILCLLGVASWLMAKKAIKPFYFLLAIAAIGAVGFGAFYATNPDAVKAMLAVLVPSGTQLTTIEMQPLLFPSGTFTFAIAWGNFGLAFFAALASLGVLARVAVKRGDAIATIIVVWSVVILAMALGQRRFAYYLSVNVAVLTGYLSWLALKWAGLREWKDGEQLVDAKKGQAVAGKVKAGKAKARRASQPLLSRGINVSMVGAILGLIVVAPIIPSTVSVASHATYAPSDAWCESLDWLRNNSPEPFGNPNAYYSLDGDNSAAYGVMSWWDFGYWITRIAHRIPNANPSQNPAKQVDAARFLTAQDEAGEIAQRLKSRYVMIDLDTVMGKFWAVATYAGKSPSDYFGVYYVQNESQYQAVQLYYPDYYRSLAVRLYNFDGKAVEPSNVFVVSFEIKKDNKGAAFNLISDVKQFNSYAEAESFMQNQQSGNWRIVSNNPFASPVPLEAVNSYELAYASSQKQSVNSVGDISEVKIFKKVE
jgi:dolichyl-diphosphooligosaccharide--protein glycosyltransferase